MQAYELLTRPQPEALNLENLPPLILLLILKILHDLTIL